MLATAAYMCLSPRRLLVTSHRLNQRGCDGTYLQPLLPPPAPGTVRGAGVHIRDGDSDLQRGECRAAGGCASARPRWLHSTNSFTKLKQLKLKHLSAAAGRKCSSRSSDSAEDAVDSLVAGLTVAAAAVFAGWAISAPPASLMAAVCFDQEASKTLGNSAKTLCTRRVY